jgi:predicted 3-demethylubiquinone-9 3-methyltransferase (glyoxalase superfamily)
MARTVTPFLMFEGRAEEAMTFYVSLFPGSELVSIERYGAGEVGAEGSVRLAEIRLASQRVLGIDSPAKHGFGFTPAISLFVECERERELRELFERLVDGGKVLMPVGNYGFSTLFGWLEDRFGVSWQLNLA